MVYISNPSPWDEAGGSLVQDQPRPFRENFSKKGKKEGRRQGGREVGREGEGRERKQRGGGGREGTRQQVFLLNLATKHLAWGPSYLTVSLASPLVRTVFVRFIFRSQLVT